MFLLLLLDCHWVFTKFLMMLSTHPIHVHLLVNLLNMFVLDTSYSASFVIVAFGVVGHFPVAGRTRKYKEKV